MKKKKLITFILLIVLTITVFFAFLHAFAYQRIYPEDGTWYCAELNIYLNFGRKAISKAIIAGEEIDCIACFLQDSSDITVERIDDDNNTDVIFTGKFVSLKNNKLVLRHRQTQVEYTFIRID